MISIKIHNMLLIMKSPSLMGLCSIFFVSMFRFAENYQCQESTNSLGSLSHEDNWIDFTIIPYDLLTGHYFLFIKDL